MIVLVMEFVQPLTMYHIFQDMTTTIQTLDLAMERVSDTPIGIRNRFNYVNAMVDFSEPIVRKVRLLFTHR